MGGGGINTTMKINTILNEGLEKVPQELIDRCMNIICGTLFSHMLAYTDTDDLIDVNDTIRKYALRYQQIYGKLRIVRIDPDGQGYYLPKVTLRIPVKSIDPRYNRSNTTRTVFNVDVYVGYRYLDDTKGEFSVDNKTGKSTLMIDMAYTPNFDAFTSAPEMIPSIVTDIEGTVEHELVHGIQGLLMGVDVGAEADKYLTRGEDGQVNGVDNAKYYTSQIEFGPNVIGSYKTFLAQLGSLQQQGVKFDLQRVKELAAYAVDPSKPLPSYLKNFDRPEMFDVLYEVDKQKWKKAVKYFYGLLDKLIDKNFNGQKS